MDLKKLLVCFRIPLQACVSEKMKAIIAFLTILFVFSMANAMKIPKIDYNYFNNFFLADQNTWDLRNIFKPSNYFIAEKEDRIRRLLESGHDHHDMPISLRHIAKRSLDNNLQRRLIYGVKSKDTKSKNNDSLNENFPLESIPPRIQVVNSEKTEETIEKFKKYINDWIDSYDSNVEKVNDRVYDAMYEFNMEYM